MGLLCWPTVHFFHVTPIGKLLALFTKGSATIDDASVDNMLSFSSESCSTLILPNCF
jgi:hypothetical protein